MSDLRTQLEWYIKKGFYLIPCYRGDKRTYIKNYNEDASRDIEELMKWSRQYPNCNWALVPKLSKHFIIDIDTKNQGVEYWNTLIETHGKPETLIQKSAGGGFHYVFKAKPNAVYKGKIKRNIGIDTRVNNYIVVSPSQNAKGGRYEWLNDLDPIELPQWLADIFERKPEKPKALETEFTTGVDYFKKIATQLKEKEFDYNTWVSIGMAIHSVFPDEDGLELWKEITQGINYADGDLDKADYKWNGFRSGGGLKPGSFIHIARDLGCIIPPLSLEEDKALFKRAELDAFERIELEKRDNDGWFRDGEKMVSVHESHIIKDFNNMGYAVLTHNPAGKIVQTQMRPDGTKSLSIMSKEAFLIQSAKYHYKHYTYTQSKGYVAKYAPAANVWLTSEDRQNYSSVVFKPRGTIDELNMWSDIPCTPLKGDVSDFITLCVDIIAGGNEDKGLWLIQFLADTVQNPARKCSIVPVLIGDEGTGKGLLVEGIMNKILGPLFYKIMTAQTLKERFNDDQAYRILTFIDEATWRGDKVEDGILKALTGSQFLTVEQKFGGRFTVENFSRYIIASNNDEAVAIGQGNRRYLVFEVSSAYKGNTDYFGRIWTALLDGDLANNIFYFLQNVNLSNFNPNVLPVFDNQGGTTKIASFGTLGHYWADFFFGDDDKPFFHNGDFLIRPMLHHDYTMYRKEVGSYERNQGFISFWKRSAALMPELNNVAQRRIDGVKTRGVEIKPHALMVSLCKSLKIDLPDYFDPEKYIAKTLDSAD